MQLKNCFVKLKFQILIIVKSDVNCAIYDIAHNIHLITVLTSV